MTKDQKKFITGVKQHTKAISDARDMLRDLVADAEEVINDSDDAIECLEQAIEFLSRNL